MQQVVSQHAAFMTSTLAMLSPGESWAPDVQKMLAVHEDDGQLGVIYLDLFPRSGPFRWLT